MWKSFPDKSLDYHWPFTNLSVAKTWAWAVDQDDVIIFGQKFITTAGEHSPSLL